MTRAPVEDDKDEVLGLVATALSWDLYGHGLPAVDVALGMAETFSRYGRNIADELRTQCLSVPADSWAGLGAQATLGEAGRRLTLRPLAPTAAPRSAAHRAQNLARLVQALTRAIDQVSEERARSSPPAAEMPPGAEISQSAHATHT
ncbi:DUF6415 family natural product biosynthesis protein [Streptomyces sp. MBT33]|uniref:DUF6415 family natural product biosynthesis protein n=1 Tax=Streptomyces sp. MBT33 TaxID=1488363 RepID=UPI00190C2032|nr:DUF6415 family natural product biosynthesis protein [Streptomyces sp. MBT33]MBK3639480.1 hypothetical protein [Streptomyces sp. MBT33]